MQCIYFGIDTLILIFLQVLTMRSSNALNSESTIATSAKINKRITKLSMRIMIMLCFFIAPLHIVTILQNDIQDQLSGYGNSLLEFASFIFSVFFWANSFANAILFLITKVKAKRLLRNLRR